MIGSQGHLTLWRVLLVSCALVKNSITDFFSKWINFKIRHYRSFHCHLSKTSLHYVTAPPSEANSLSPTVQLDPRNVRSPKWSVGKVIWMSEKFPECNMTSCRNSFKVNSFQMIQFPNKPLKKINCAFDKIRLLLRTVLESEARSFLPTVQLDFSWTFEMSDWQNDRIARPSDSLKSSQSTICIN